MLNVYIDRTKNLLVLESDEPGLNYFLETSVENYEYIPWQKKWGYTKKLVKIYEPRKGRRKSGQPEKYEIGLGWAGYILGVLGGKMTKDNYEEIMKEAVYSDTYRDSPFYGLRDYQNDDVLFLLKYRRGLMTVNTGYGWPNLNLPHCVSEKSGKIGED